MKVAQVTLRFDAPGGVETNVREVSRRLRASGVEVEVFASDLYDESRWDRRSDFPPVVDGIPVHRFPVFKQLIPGLTMPLMPGLIDALAGSGADVIHAHSHRYGHVLEAAFVAYETGIPLIVSTHYHPADRRESALKRGMLRLQDFGFGATAYRIARALVVESEVERQLVAEFAPAARIRVIPPGVDLGEWDESSAGPPPAGLPPRYLVFAGRIASNKGLDVLVEAVSQLDPPDRIPIVIMGPDWGEKRRLVALAQRLGVSDVFVWLGRVPDASSYRAVIRGATVLILPSEWEAFGIVALESMAAGTPVIASAVGALPEVLEGGRAGRLVAYGDAGALARAIRELTSDEVARRTLADAGRARGQQFDWSRSASLHLELYRALAARN